MHQKHFCCAKCINHVNLIIELFNEANRFKNVVGDHSIVFVHKEKHQPLRPLMSARLQELISTCIMYLVPKVVEILGSEKIQQIACFFREMFTVKCQSFQVRGVNLNSFCIYNITYICMQVLSKFMAFYVDLYIQ